MHTFYLGKSLLHKSFLYKRCAFTFKLLRLLCQSEDDNVTNTKLTFDILKQGSNSQVCTNVSNTQGLPMGGGMLKFSIDQHIRFMLHLYMLSVSTDSSFLTNWGVPNHFINEPFEPCIIIRYWIFGQLFKTTLQHQH